MSRPIARFAAFLLVAVIGIAAAVPVEAVDPQYRNLIRAGRRYLMHGQNERAEEVYRQVLEQHPLDEQAATGLASALINQGKLDEADAFLGKALAEIEITVNLYRKRVDLRRLQGRPADAFSDALEVMGQNDGLTPWTFQETRELLEEGLDPGEAADRARKALERNPDNPNFAVLAAVILTLDGDKKKAMELVTEVDREKKQGGRTVMRYAEELLVVNDRAGAESAMQLAADSADQPARRSQFLFQLADLVEEDGRYEDALAHLQTIATEREGTSAAGKALIRSAAIYQDHLDDPAGALGVYEKLKDDPSIGHHRPRMLLQMGDCYVRLGRFEEAAGVYDEVLPEALDPEEAEEAAFRRAEAVFFAGEADSAMTLYQEMAETYRRSLLTDDAAQRYIELNGLRMSGDWPAVPTWARLEWARSVGDSAATEAAARTLIGESDGGLAAEAWLALADLAETAGEFETALERLDKVAAGYPSDRRAPIALKRRGDILQREMNRTQDALAAYERILTEYPDSVQAAEIRRVVENIRRGLKS